MTSLDAIEGRVLGTIGVDGGSLRAGRNYPTRHVLPFKYPTCVFVPLAVLFLPHISP